MSTEAEQARQALNVPGKMHCAKCKFSAQLITLNTGDGTVTAGESRPQKCPNGCGPMWPVTWEQEARQCWVDNLAMFERAHKAETELAELKSRLGPR